MEVRCRARRQHGRSLRTSTRATKLPARCLRNQSPCRQGARLPSWRCCGRPPGTACPSARPSESGGLPQGGARSKCALHQQASRLSSAWALPRPQPLNTGRLRKRPLPAGRTLAHGGGLHSLRHNDSRSRLPLVEASRALSLRCPSTTRGLCLRTGNGMRTGDTESDCRRASSQHASEEDARALAVAHGAALMLVSDMFLKFSGSSGGPAIGPGVR